ncbi:hypothetical protein AAVH_16446 [Aphelenchoides avenae]|nr:hypothetical protein AAVH_16446 [Aphelenchus avenae]
MLNLRALLALNVVLVAALALLIPQVVARPQMPTMLQTLYMPGFDAYSGNQYELFGRR